VLLSPPTFRKCVANLHCEKDKSKVKVKSNYFIVRPKVDQRAGLLRLPHLGNFHHTAPHLPLLRKHSPEGTPVLNGVHF